MQVYLIFENWCDPDTVYTRENGRIIFIIDCF